MHMVLVGCSVILGMEPSEAWAVERLSHLQRAKVFLQAGDYRQALEACQAEVRDRPSARSYVYLTYVYHAVNGYLEQLAATDQWVRVEHLYLNLATGRPEDLVDPPDVLARIAKELIQQAVQRQSDVTAAMAARLDEAVVQRLWEEQTAWRKARAADWWAGVPLEWHWERP
ncbi:MAG: hypothetical protein DYH04_03120 [Nitrospira sp. NTP2]|nr:hypothetical protein [Nitrospira sp. NTP2]RIK60305.1 MAG: hypothetical protein DCC63_04320 [Nitrospira sp.]